VGEFGNRFRQAREKKELSLDDVSNVTKISARMLRAIEEEHFDQLPGGVFNKGFIRAYAKHLGLDPEEAVTDYLACLRQAQIDAQQVWEPAVSAKPGSAQPFTGPERRRTVEPAKPAVKVPSSAQVEELPGLQLPRAEHVASQKEFALKPDREVPWSILAIAAIVVALAVVLWIRRSHTGAASTTPPAKSAQSTAATSTPAAPTPGREDPAPPVNQPSNPAPANHTAPLVAATSRPPQSAPSSATANHAPTAATPTSSSAASTSNNEPNDDVTNRTFTKPVAPPAKSTAASLTLVIRASETSWISVQADGQTVSQETLIAPAHASIRASREIIAKIGNAAGVTFLWNGREIPANGAESEVKTFIFDANGMRVVPTTQPASNH
jgi:cytoskeleton protein RodZ